MLMLPLYYLCVYFFIREWMYYNYIYTYHIDAFKASASPRTTAKVFLWYFQAVTLDSLVRKTYVYMYLWMCVHVHICMCIWFVVFTIASNPAFLNRGPMAHQGATDLQSGATSGHRKMQFRMQKLVVHNKGDEIPAIEAYFSIICLVFIQCLGRDNVYD